MLSVPVLALGLSVLVINTSALPVPDHAETGDLSPALSPRSEGSFGESPSIEKRDSPNLGLVLSLLEGHGFLPDSTKTTSVRAATTAKPSTKPTVAPASTNRATVTPKTSVKATTTPVRSTAKSSPKATVTPTTTKKATSTAKSSTKLTTTAKSSTKTSSHTTAKATTTKRARGLPLPRRTPLPAHKL